MDFPINILSWNVQGLRNRNKRASVFRLLKQQKITIAALQETYITDEEIELIKKEWKGPVHLQEGTKRSKGLLTLFSNKLSDHEIKLIYKTDRIIVSRVNTNNDSLTVVNIYAPCADGEKIEFLSNVSDTIKRYVPSADMNDIVCLGDFNNVMNNDLDITAGASHSRTSVEKFNEWARDLNVFDVWRLKHNDIKTYSWSRSSIARRLDYIFLGENIFNFSTESTYKSFGQSDHRACLCTIAFSRRYSKNNTYKLNTSLLGDKEYISIINKTIDETIRNNQGLNPHLLWEMIKVGIRETSKQYSRYINMIKRMSRSILYDKLNELEEQIAQHPTEEELHIQVRKVKNQLELEERIKTRGAQIRAGIKWIEEGEKCTKFFIGLEKTRANSNTVFRLQGENGKIEQKPEQILHSLQKYYENLYKENKRNEYINHLSENFISNLDLPKISQSSKATCEEPITEKEIHATLKSLKNGSAPGPDGIPVEFYKIFWDKIKEPLMEAFQYSYGEGKLTHSQRQAGITLLHKGKHLPKENMANWRPISLTNTDYKIIAKVWGNRLKLILPEIISKDQFGFLKSRNITDLIREMDDIIENLKNNNNQNIILSIDYAKAFDTVSTTLILNAISWFGFGNFCYKWLAVLLKDRHAFVKNGGNLSRPFTMERGVRQGCPVSPLLFIMVAELLAISIRQDDNIEGIRIGDRTNTEIKIRQFADDTTLFLRGIIDYREVLAKIKIFSDFSGLTLNEKKSKAILFGSSSLDGKTENQIEFVTSLKILGIYFSKQHPAGNMEVNWETKIEAIERTLNLWSKRNLSIIGKIQIIKTLIISHLNYVMESISIPMPVLSDINRRLFRFIWRKRYTNKRAVEKVKRTVICSPYEKGD